MEYRPPAGPLLKALYVAFGASVVLVAFTGYRALHLAPLPGPKLEPEPHTVSTPRPGDAVPLWSAVRVVQRDPFNPARRAPERRYILPEKQAASDTTAGKPLVTGSVRLVGTSVAGKGDSFAMCQLGRDAPKVLHVGDRLGDMTLRSVAPGQAEFAREDGSIVTLKVAGPS